MKNIIVTALLFCLLSCFDACSKRSDKPQMANKGIMLAYPTGYTFNSLFSGLNYSDLANLNLALTDQSDTVRFSANTPDTANAGLKVTIGVDASQVAAYNGASQQSYTLMPSNCYTLVDSIGTVTAVAGQAGAIFRVVFYPKNFDPGISYMLPISIMGVSPDLPVNQSMKTIYFHQMKR